MSKATQALAVFFFLLSAHLSCAREFYATGGIFSPDDYIASIRRNLDMGRDLGAYGDFNNFCQLYPSPENAARLKKHFNLSEIAGSVNPLNSTLKNDWKNELAMFLFAHLKNPPPDKFEMNEDIMPVLESIQDEINALPADKRPCFFEDDSNLLPRLVPALAYIACAEGIWGEKKDAQKADSLARELEAKDPRGGWAFSLLLTDIYANASIGDFRISEIDGIKNRREHIFNMLKKYKFLEYGLASISLKYTPHIKEMPAGMAKDVIRILENELARIAGEKPEESAREFSIPQGEMIKYRLADLYLWSQPPNRNVGRAIEILKDGRFFYNAATLYMIYTDGFGDIKPDPEKARSHIKGLEKWHPNPGDLEDDISNIYHAGGDRDKAFKWAIAAAEKGIFYGLRNVLFPHDILDAQNPEEFSKYISRIPKDIADNPEIAENMAAYNFRCGNMERAADFLEKHIRHVQSKPHGTLIMLPKNLYTGVISYAPKRFEFIKDAIRSEMEEEICLEFENMKPSEFISWEKDHDVIRKLADKTDKSPGEINTLAMLYMFGHPEVQKRAKAMELLENDPNAKKSAENLLLLMAIYNDDAEFKDPQKARAAETEYRKLAGHPHQPDANDTFAHERLLDFYLGRNRMGFREPYVNIPRAKKWAMDAFQKGSPKEIFRLFEFCESEYLEEESSRLWDFMLKRYDTVAEFKNYLDKISDPNPNDAGEAAK